jgi:hypothetical protein
MFQKHMYFTRVILILCYCSSEGWYVVFCCVFAARSAAKTQQNMHTPDHPSPINCQLFDETLVEWERNSMMKSPTHIFLCVFFLVGLASCDVPTSLSQVTSNPDIALQVQTVSVVLTATARAAHPSPSADVAVVSTRPPINPATVPIVSTDTPTVSLEIATIPPKPATAVPPCDLAQPGRPIDVTIPDDTRLAPGQVFSKTWRLVNAGQCPWTRDYAVVWFSGDDLGMSHMQSFDSIVLPGDSVDFTVDMVAPQQAGTYQSNWKLRGKDGHLFGIGSNGDAPFWVRVLIVTVDTPTATVTPFTPQPTSTPSTFASGSTSLQLNDQFNLDSGQLNQGTQDDLSLELSPANVLLLVPQNSAKLSLVGMSAPSLGDCSSVALTEDSLGLDQVPVGSYACYRTTDGLPGRFSVITLDVANNQVGLEFLTWSVP